ncbi:acyltransferase [Caldovatus sediminis]|uniref:Acyltransferase n=1 Tax=Caldovatus sediminis TaxID=2041189 RepID=A0A8J2Z934_9PROT|nr:acyltransferase [Caldovatus sediminis]GGG25482.1 acyltransferase [Caldovatus sediminis]
MPGREGRAAVAPAGAAAPGGAAPPRVAALTRLRLLFIGWVVIYHLELALGALRGVPVAEAVVRKGWLGVDGFFLLSGFALWLGYHRRPPWGLRGHARFLGRRLARLYPLHALALLALAALVGLAALAGLQVNDPTRFGMRDFWLQALLVNSWETTDVLAWNYPSWALSAEWAGYLAFPLLLAAVLAAPRPALLAVPPLALAALLALGARDPGAGLNLTVHLGLLRFASEFVLGLALGRLCAESPRPGAVAPAALAIAGLCVPGGIALGVDTVTVAGLAALIAGGYCREAARPAPATPPRDLALRLGEASYGVYLCWVFVEAALVLLLRVADPSQPARLALMGVALGVNLAAGWLAWRLVEVPAQRWLLARMGG